MDGVFCPRRTSDDVSQWVDLSNNQVIHHYKSSEEIENNFIEWWDQNPEDRLLRTVYNIEVENTHTYFVGTDGVWVHNKNAALRGEEHEGQVKHCDMTSSQSSAKAHLQPMHPSEPKGGSGWNG